MVKNINGKLLSSKEREKFILKKVNDALKEIGEKPDFKGPIKNNTLVIPIFFPIGIISDIKRRDKEAVILNSIHEMLEDAIINACKERKDI